MPVYARGLLPVPASSKFIRIRKNSTPETGTFPVFLIPRCAIYIVPSALTMMKNVSVYNELFGVLDREKCSKM